MPPKQQEMLRGAAVLTLVAAALTALLWLFLPQAPVTPPETQPPETQPSETWHFYMDGDYMACSNVKTALGVDVSYHQGKIDWSKVSSVMDFAMIRLGYRGNKSGEIHKDTQADYNLQEARANGLDIGVYFYSQAISQEEAREEAHFVLEQLADMPLEYPVVYDWEYSGSSTRTANMTRQEITACALAFCREIQQAGYKPMVYFNLEMAITGLDLEAVEEYDFWFALYRDRMDFTNAVDMWQYTDSGKVPGIKGKVDVNLAFLEQLPPV